jgi:hypothetical protein
MIFITIHIGIASLQFDAGAWGSRLEASPTKKGPWVLCGSGILPRKLQVIETKRKTK